MKRTLLTCIAVSMCSGGAWADTAKVVADIAPLHSVVARVMQGVGAPDLLLPTTADPHDYAMRPSDAKALQQADLIVTMGEELVPWVEDTIAKLAPNATVIEVLHAPGVELLPMRGDGHHHGHGHGDEEPGHEEPGHEDHAHEEHAHEEPGHEEPGHEEHAHEEHAHEEHAHEEPGHEEPGHEAIDPHAWLDPAIASIWAGEIAEELARIDPENAEAYRQNAADAQQEYSALGAVLKAQLAPIQGQPYVIYHDAYQYFEHAMGVAPLEFIEFGDATDPGPARLKAIENEMAEHNVKCLFAEYGTRAEQLATMFGDSVTTSTLDPVGAGLTPGAALYPQLLTNLANDMVSCLAE